MKTETNLILRYRKLVRIIVVALSVLFPFLGTAVGTETGLPSAVVPDGLCVNYNYVGVGGDGPDVINIQGAGFKFIRVDLTWDVIERVKGQYDFTNFDGFARACANRNIRLHWNLNYGNPRFYGTDLDSPAWRQAFLNYAVAAVTHYKGRGNIYELWNESNCGFWPGASEVGKVDQYMALANLVLPAIREADPTCTLLAPATTGVDYAFLDSCFRRGLHHYVDAISVHPYRHESSPDPESVVADYAVLRQLLNKYKPGMPIVCSEWGWSTSPGFTATNGISAETQGNYLARMFLVNLSERIPLSSWYTFKDRTTDPADVDGNFGMMTLTHDAKPAWREMRRLVDALAGKAFTERLASEPSDWLLVFNSPDGQQHTLAAWTTKTSPCDVTVAGWGTLHLTAKPSYVNAANDSEYVGPASRLRGDQTFAKVKLAIEPGHLWTPPFGLERVGRPMEAVIEVPEGTKLPSECVVVEYGDGKEMGRQAVTFMANLRPKSHFGRVALGRWPAEVAVLMKAEPQAEFVEIARAAVSPPAFEAEALARPEQTINPVDLGTILVPADWLLLAGGGKAEIEIAVLKRDCDMPGASVNAWYESAPEKKIHVKLPLIRGEKATAKIALGPASKTLLKDQLHVAVVNGAGAQLWRKDIGVMLVPEPPKCPCFGAVATKLRYDLPIACRGGKTIEYENGWDPKLQDVVVFLPGGGRFVFWRAASYCPFWAGKSNTGLSYEWAEREPPADACDAVEPLMDQELRFGRVEIVESTPARVHVRWHYQLCDIGYKTWGDSAVEDYLFYPDGFGTRTLTLTCAQGARYEMNEFIVIRPPMGYPLDVLPSNPIDMVWIDGGQQSFRFPRVGAERTEFRDAAWNHGAPPIFRIRINKCEQLTPIQYSPWAVGPRITCHPHWDDRLGIDSPERGAMVAPVWSCNWWPLSRGGGSLETSPGTSCLATTGWGDELPAGSLIHTPLRSEMCWARDVSGQVKPLRHETYTWLIGMADASDDLLRQWAQSFAKPPALEVLGAKIEGKSSYAPERRALCLALQRDKKNVAIKITPAGVCVNPVFEFQDAPKTLVGVRLGDRILDNKQYAWDGHTLWLNATLTQPSTLLLDFGGEQQ